MSAPTQQPQDHFFGGGSGIPSLSFADQRCIGFWRGGVIVHIDAEQQQRDAKDNKPKFFKDSGNPMMQLPITLATEERDPGNPDDDGHRRLFIKNKLRNAVADAFRAAGAPGLRLGGRLMVRWTHGGENGNTERSKFWEAHYTPPQGQQTDQYFAPSQQTSGQPQLPMHQQLGHEAGSPPQNAPQWQPPAAVQQAAQYVASADAQPPPVPAPNSNQPWMTGPPQPVTQTPQQGYQQPAQAAPQWQPPQAPQNHQVSPPPTPPAAQQQGQPAWLPSPAELAAQQAPQQGYPPNGQQPVYQPPPFDPTDPFGQQPAQQPQQGPPFS